jgi:hypothetical protein
MIFTHGRRCDLRVRVTAADRVAAVRALIPTLGDHAVIPGSAAASTELDAAWALLDLAVTLDPASAEVHALRGNLLVRRGDTAAARRSYALAARIDPYDAPSRIALGELAFMAGAVAESERWFAEAFALSHLYAPAAPGGTRVALVLCVAGPWHRNIPLDFVVDPARWTLHRWYLPDPDAARTRLRLPAYDLVINAIGESDAARDAIAAAAAFIAAQPAPAVNDPQHVGRTGRAALADALRAVPACATASSRRLTRAELAALACASPLLVRPADAHGGRGLERVDDAAALADYLTRTGGDAFDVSPFVEYRSADGYYRKYRVMFVDGVPYAYHLAIDRTWMIHYHRAPMDEHAWMREEERRFIERPDAAIPCWSTTLPAIAAALGLDYVGIDATVLADGTLFVFEADAAMLVHDFDPDPAKHGAYGRISAALDALLGGRAGASATFLP